MTTKTIAPNAKTRILGYFQRGTDRTMTVAQARSMFKIKNVTARISELRADGHDIRTTMTEDRTGRERAVYSLMPARARNTRRTANR